MSKLTMQSWSNSGERSSSRFKMTSKYTDLGSPDGKKSLLGVMLNVSIDAESTASFFQHFHVNVAYRTSPASGLKQLVTFSNIYNPNETNKGNFEVIKMLPAPIKNIQNIQLQIRAIALTTNMGINDFGLIFREYRSSSVVTFDEK